MVRNRLIVFATTIALCSPGLADEPAPSNKSENEASLRALIERLEARVSELEKQVQQLKRAQQQSVLGGSLLEAEPFQLMEGLDRSGSMRVDRRGIIRDAAGRVIGYWGFDLTPPEGVAVPVPRR